MTWESLGLLTGILAGATWTPGPNNAMLASSGATFGFRRTFPHILGVALGFAIMIFFFGLGLGAVFEAFPILERIMTLCAILLLTWVAWRIANAGQTKGAKAEARPFTFLQAAGFQWINPKAWAMCLSIAAAFVSGEGVLVQSAIVGAVSAMVGMSSASAWAGFGHAMQRVLRVPARLRLFNIVMAGLVMLGVAYLVMDLLSA